MSANPNKPTLKQLHRWFSKAGLVSIATVSAIIIVGLWGINRQIAPLSPLTMKIHAASEQAIRAQTISILAADLAAAKRPGMLYTFRTQLAAEVSEFEAVHRGLMLGDASRGLSGSMSANVHEHLYNPITGLDRFARDFTDQVRRDFLSDALTVKNDLADGLSEVIQLQLSPRLVGLTDLLAQEMRSSVHRLQATMISILAIALLAMLCLGRFVLRPLEIRVTKSIITDAKNQEKNALRFDEITGLANRAHLLAFMAEHCVFIQKHDLRTAVLNVEIQGADAIREELGAEDGDEMMSMIARRIESVCRSGDFIAKVGSSEFVIVLTSVEDDTALNDMTNALRTKLAMPLQIDKQSFNLKTKIGIKIATGKDKVPAAVLNQAATALKIAKASDNYDIQFFSSNLAPKAKQREQDVQHIKEGLKSGQFIAHFQPIVDLQSGATIGLEAFARWHHPKRGVLAPIHFMEIVKNCDLANDVTRTVLGDVLKALREWQTQSLAVPFVSINIDVQQLEDKAFVDELAWILDSYNIKPAQIALEFSESAFLPDANPDIQGNLKQLSDHGFRIVLDDFGTLGLHLNTVRAVQLEHVKLERAFVANLDSETQQQSTARGLVDQARASRVKVVASGVETPAERTILGRIKADAIQGYLICEPVDADQLTDWLKKTPNLADVKSA